MSKFRLEAYRKLFIWEIFSIEESEGILRKSIVINVNGEVVKISSILSGNGERVKDMIKWNIKVGRGMD